MLEVKTTMGSQRRQARHQIMLVGGVGGGKTTLTLSLRGRKFYYLFDPNALAALEHEKDIDYIEFLPDAPGDLYLAARTLVSAKEKGKHDEPSVAAEPRLYVEWEKDFNERRRMGFFDKYDWIILDSATTFQDAIYDRVQWLNGRFGKQPEEADHGAQMNTFRQDMRALSTLTNLCVTCHIETQKDGLDGRIHGRIMMTGKNRLRVPSLFAHILACETTEEGRYVVYTRPTRMHPVVRTSIRGLKPQEDVTMDFTRPLKGQGLDRILGSLNLQTVGSVQEAATR